MNEPQRMLIRAGRVHRFECECGRSHEVEFSLPQPGTSVIGLKVTKLPAPVGSRLTFESESERCER
jgi:hypothetical protein